MVCGLRKFVPVDRPFARRCGFLGLQKRAVLIDPDGRKPAPGDAQRDRSVLLVTAPDRQRAARRDFFDQALGQEFADHFGGGADSSALSGARRADVTGLGARIPRVET